LEQVPRYGTIVRTPQRRDIVELYELREALEGFAVGQAAAQIGAADLTLLARLCDEMKRIGGRLRPSRKGAREGEMMERSRAADRASQWVIRGAAGNGRLLKIAGESRVLTRIIGIKRQDHTPAVVEGPYRYHRRILRALQQHDAKEARKLL